MGGVLRVHFWRAKSVLAPPPHTHTHVHSVLVRW
jgi:hypothetical protein